MKATWLLVLAASLLPIEALAADRGLVFLESTYRLAAASALPTASPTATPAVLAPASARTSAAPVTTVISVSSVPSGPIGPDVSLGIGSIVLRSELGSGSFSAAKHLAANPIRAEGTNVSVRLVDSNVETDYTVSGTVADSVTPASARTSGGMYYLGGGLETGGLAIGTGLVILGYAVRKPEIRNIGTGVFVLVPVGVLLQHNASRTALIRQSTFRRNLTADLTLRRNGKTVKKFQVKVDDILVVPMPDQPHDLRDNVLAPVWSGLSREVAQQITADAQAGGVRK